MASLGVRKFQDLIGRTELLKVRDDIKVSKAKMLDFTSILRNALELRPGTNIVGGSIKQEDNFQLDQRPDNLLIEKAQPVLNKEQKRIDIEMTINNETRAFASTLSYHISKSVSYFKSYNTRITVCCINRKCFNLGNEFQEVRRGWFTAK